MFRQQIRLALLAGGIVAATGWTVCANDCCQPAPCAPTMRTVRVKEWVPEKYETTRTVYRTEQRQENYTAYRCETVQEQRTRTCVVNHYVPCQVERCRTVCGCRVVHSMPGENQLAFRLRSPFPQTGSGRRCCRRRTTSEMMCASGKMACATGKNGVRDQPK